MSVLLPVSVICNQPYVISDDDKQPEQEQGTGEKITQHFHLLTPETDLTDNSIRGKYLGLGFVRDTDFHGAHSDCEAAALGQ